MFRTALRNVLAHKARLLMTVLAVTLGVAFVSGTLVFTDTLGKALSGQSAKSYSGVAVSVTSYGQARSEEGRKEGDPGISQQTLDKVKAVKGVGSVSGRVSGFAGVGDENGKLIGTGWANKGSNYAPVKDGKDPRYTFTDGTGPVKDDQVALDKETAAKGGYKTGDKVRVATNGPVREFTLAGVFTTEDGAVNAGGSLVLFDTKVAQELYLQPGFYDELSVAAAPGASADRLLADIKPLVDGKTTKAQTGAALAAQQAKDIEKGMSSMSNMLLAFAGISLFVGVFLIYNTFTMLVAQRTKELALLRAVGANRGQVMRSVLAEALVVGALSAAIGLAAGVGLAVGMRSLMDTIGAKIPAGDLVVAPGTIIAALVIGVLVTTVAALLPAWRTGRIAPVAAMGSAHLPASAKSLVVRNVIGSVISLAGIGVVFLGVSMGGDGRMVIGGGAFLMLVGMIVLLPLLSRPVIAAVRPALQKVFGVPGKLAAQNAVRNPRRTAVTAASLAIGLTLVTTMSVLGVTMGKAIDRMSTDKLKADYKVTMSGGVGSLDKSVAETLAKAPGVKAVSPQAAGYFKIGDNFHAASGVNPAAIGQVLNIKVVSGSLDSLGKGEVAVAEKTAKKQNLTVGSALQAQFEDGEKAALKVGAVYEDLDGLLSPYVIDNKILAAHTDQQFIPEVYVNTTGGQSKASQQAVIDALGKNPAMTVATQQDMRNEMGGLINTMLNIMYGLLGMALIISVLGVVNTLAMSVFERTQEIGMLRAIGLDRARVKNMIRLESVVISLFGAVLGVGIGVFLAWAVGSTLTKSVPNYELVLPYDRIGVFLLLAAVVGILAAMWPARSAARLNMLTAIKTE
ncbi:ABC transporter permease [Streptomyces lavendulae]|uniref:ABC transporter permease n=1 Tax=Streptomyces lavendulae TaxID=1914 RepID=UPI0024A380F0|nr:ABC transporter permease [Streptomyces lavendulae]GLX20920.1 ABC transporter [Streptomyces lavendulae subsp. lavendulae]GLX25795.1 ABC transporter [Streptomyces lavendulae subsp. lavendulae]